MSINVNLPEPNCYYPLVYLYRFALYSIYVLIIELLHALLKIKLKKVQYSLNALKMYLSFCHQNEMSNQPICIVKKIEKEMLQSVLYAFNRNIFNDVSFRAQFGVPLSVCTHVWNLIGKSEHFPNNSEQKHLIWDLLFFKAYSTEEAHSSACGIPKPSFRRWSWIVVKIISSLI